MNDPKEFVSRFDRVLDAGISQVTRAVERGNMGMPPDASLLNHARMIFCLEGRATFQMQQWGSIVAVGLSPGEGLFVAPQCWVRAQPQQPYLSMGVVFYPQVTRFYLKRGEPAENWHPGNLAENFSVPVGLSEAGRALCCVMADVSPARDAERHFCHALDCLTIVTRELLALPLEAGGKARIAWRTACDFIVDNLHRPLSRQEVAWHVSVHPNHLSRLFTLFGNETFSEFLHNQRLERARLLLSDSRINISEVARLSGFSDVNYFIRIFRKSTGRTPARARG
jgi:AraC-like DNA-binding protein